MEHQKFPSQRSSLAVLRDRRSGRSFYPKLFTTGAAGRRQTPIYQLGNCCLLVFLWCIVWCEQVVVEGEVVVGRDATTTPDSSTSGGQQKLPSDAHHWSVQTSDEDVEALASQLVDDGLHRSAATTAAVGGENEFRDDERSPPPPLRKADGEGGGVETSSDGNSERLREVVAQAMDVLKADSSMMAVSEEERLHRTGAEEPTGAEAERLAVGTLLSGIEAELKDGEKRDDEAMTTVGGGDGDDLEATQETDDLAKQLAALGKDETEKVDMFQKVARKKEKGAKISTAVFGGITGLGVAVEILQKIAASRRSSRGEGRNPFLPLGLAGVIVAGLLFAGMRRSSKGALKALRGEYARRKIALLEEANNERISD